ncbi:alpha/beta hydrolase [Calothrix sp. UHCC 0171]|uniref:alpha/beta hydrolase n=1 Tax=Calothrix sp. UHCC 0171 TaxID=3110245 RepID=UPI002B20E50B|nr:alpha/beta hydrolase [Calothrix sp. UHCC 0171]MEA5569961.1 alpha/beta hydrolase [Calothrix sp. UHCC 0171]
MTPKNTKQQHYLKTILSAVSSSIFSILASATPGLSASRIAFYYPPLGEFTISADDIELFAKEGKITEDLAFYINRIPKAQRSQFRELLNTRFQVNATLVSQFTYSQLGEKVVERLGTLLQTESRAGNFFALRSALILSANEPQGLNIVNIIRRYPSHTIRLNFSEIQGITNELNSLLNKRDAVVAQLKELTAIEAKNQLNTKANIDFAQQRDLRIAGGFTWRKQPVVMNDLFRKRVFAVDMYLPQTQIQRGETGQKIKPPLPLIVISHGVAEDRETFAYTAQHLASYGFAVAVLEHPGSDATKIQQYFSGLSSPPEARELINRPLDIKFLLDELQSNKKSYANWKGLFNLSEVGIIGHSYGGYTGLTLAGANLDEAGIRKNCNPNKSLNLSVFLQCRANELLQERVVVSNLQDSRIKAVMAINPLNSVVLGKQGLSKIQVPVMLMGGSQDIITPLVPEQVIPFTWLQTKNKYLATIENATHFSTAEKLDNSQGVLPVPKQLVGPDPAIAQTYVKSLSVAFFQTHLLNQQQYQPYLSAAYSQYISQAPLNLSFVKSLTAEELQKMMDGESGKRGIRSLLMP